MAVQKTPLQVRKELLEKERNEIMNRYAHHAKKIDTFARDVIPHAQNVHSSPKIIRVTIEFEERLKSLSDKAESGDLRVEDVFRAMNNSISQVEGSSLVEYEDLVIMASSKLGLRPNQFYYKMLRTQGRYKDSIMTKSKRLIDLFNDVYQEVSSTDFVPEEVKAPLLAELGRFKHFKTPNAFKDENSKIIEFVDSFSRELNSINNVENEADKYISFLENVKCKMPQERLKQLARERINGLESRTRNVQKLADYDKAMLRFGFYSLERARTRGNGLEDIEKVEAQLRELSETISRRSYRDNKNSLKEVRDYFNDKDFESVRAELEKISSQRDISTEQNAVNPEEAESVGEYIIDYYGLDSKRAESLLEKVSMSSLDIVDKAISGVVDNSVCVALIRGNPELLLMSERDASRYAQKLKEAVGLGLTGEDITERASEFSTIGQLNSYIQSVKNGTRYR